MPGVILAMLDHPTAACGVLAAARRLSVLSGGARINVLVARVPPASTIMSTEEVLTRDKEARLRAAEAERAAALKAIFDPWSAAGGAGDWLDIEGGARGLLIEWGRRADLIVLERPGHHQYGTTWQALPAALFETDRPVVIIPAEPAATFGQHLAIAWRDDPHAIRAVLSALRYATPETSIHLLAGVRPGAAKPRIPAILQEHNITAYLQIIPIGDEPFGLTLLARAHAIGADMLVMGAYAHSPWRQLILGGVTRSMVASADIPVLMRH
jgi:nucleotide-binding universal stress UspA family protein